MKLITTNNELTQQLNRLIDEYSEISFAVAWASANTTTFEKIVLKIDSIQRAVIGTHFYQTHPDVLDTFTESNNVRFILQPQGVFHPKVYLFWERMRWEALIGSANLTKSALTQNAEIMVLLQGEGQADAPMRREILETINNYWSEATQITVKEASRYRTIHARQYNKIKQLSGNYGDNNFLKTPIESDVMTMTWEDFYEQIQNDEYHSFKARIEILDDIGNRFINNRHFNLIEHDIRKFIAGLPNEYDERYGWFGSMSGAGYFHQAVNNNNEYLSLALDYIPLQGLVTYTQYQKFIKTYLQAFPNGRDGIGTATRLLAMKRPDQFVCFNSKNRSGLCADFGIRNAGSIDYERYWSEVILRIMDTNWWNAPEPNNELELRAWQGRAAMLDVLFYEE